MLRHNRILFVAVLAFTGQLPVTANAASFTDDAPFYQLKTTDYVTICQSYSGGCGDIQAGNYLLDSWDSDWMAIQKNKPVTVLDGGSSVPTFYQRSESSSGPGSFEANVSCDEGDLAISMTCNVLDGPSGNRVYEATGESLDMEGGIAYCVIAGNASGAVIEFPIGEIEVSVVCATR